MELLSRGLPTDTNPGPVSSSLLLLLLYLSVVFREQSLNRVSFELKYIIHNRLGKVCPLRPYV